MLPAPAILSEIACNAVNEVFKIHRLVLAPGGTRGFGSGRACAATIQGPSAAGLIQFEVEESLLERTSVSRDRRQDMVNEMTNLLIGQFEVELLRRGLAVQYRPPRAVMAGALESFDCGLHGATSYFDALPGLAAVAVRLTLEPGATLEALPTRKLPARGVGNANMPASSRRSTSVLVVDDSATARDSVATPLRDAGFQVLEADSGLTALQILRERPGIGMVFTDMHMAGISGADFIRKVKADEKLAGVPIVVLTASPSAMQGVNTNDVVTCLIKPISTAAVISLARRLLSAA